MGEGECITVETNDQNFDISKIKVGGRKTVSTVSAKQVASVEKSVLEYERYRRFVEASLSGTGLDQAQIVKTLSNVITEEAMEEIAAEIELSFDEFVQGLVQA